MPDDQVGEASAHCPTGTRATGGGVVQSGSPTFLRVLASGPLDDSGLTLQTDDGDVATRWYAAVENNVRTNLAFRVYAIRE